MGHLATTLTRTCLFATLLLPWTSMASAPSPAVDWAQATVVIAGVLEWRDPDYADFDKRKRQDKVLAQRVTALGVPPERLALLLDRDAKRKSVLETVARLAEATPVGGTFVFYFDGHGVRLDDGRIVFATSDVRSDREAETGLVLDDLRAILAERLRGRRVILLADCCHSGGLIDVAVALRRLGIEAVALTSSEASNASTGDWTYTLSLNDALGGRANLDHDRDGYVTLGELHTEVRDAMLYRESQRSGFDAGTTPLSLRLAAATPEPPPRAPKGFRVGDYATYDDEVVRVLGEQEREAIVETLDYATRTIERVDVSDLAPITFERFPVGATLKVEWEGECWEARVTAVDGAFHRITYPGWDAFWDEWVADDRIISGEETCPEPE
jgi:hypothetical protein